MQPLETSVGSAAPLVSEAADGTGWAGGGGFGNPSNRDPKAVVEDVLEGYISREKAAEDYGFQENWIAEHAPEEEVLSSD